MKSKQMDDDCHCNMQEERYWCRNCCPLPRPHRHKSWTRLQLEYICYCELRSTCLQCDDRVNRNELTTLRVPEPYRLMVGVEEEFSYPGWGKDCLCDLDATAVQYMDTFRSRDEDDDGLVWVNRAAQLLVKTADNLRAAALALAAHMGCIADVLLADAHAMALLAPPAASSSFSTREERLFHAFMWRVGRFTSSDIKKTVIAVTALSMPFDDMTPSERTAAGAVVLEDLAEAFIQGHTEQVLQPMLMVARGLQAAAIELAEAAASRT